MQDADSQRRGLPGMRISEGGASPRWEFPGTGLTCRAEAVHAQVADGQAHDGGLVQVGADPASEGQRVCQLIQHLGLLAAPAAGRIPGLLLAQLGARPAGMGSNYWWCFGKGKRWRGGARGVLPHGAQARCVVRESPQSTLAPEGLYSGAAPSLGFLSVSPSAHLLLSCVSQGRSVPSPTYLLSLPWLGTPGWGVTGRPPAGRGLAQLARSQGREGARRCMRPPRPPALHSLPELPPPTVPLLS